MNNPALIELIGYLKDEVWFPHVSLSDSYLRLDGSNPDASTFDAFRQIHWTPLGLAFHSLTTTNPNEFRWNGDRIQRIHHGLQQSAFTTLPPSLYPSVLKGEYNSDIYDALVGGTSRPDITEELARFLPRNPE